MNKSSDPDSIPNRVLKELSNEPAPSLQFIVVQSLTTGQLPSDRRKANIAPIFKKGDRHIAANCRPVSLSH